MTTPSADARAVRSRERLCDALHALLLERPFEQVRVSELCARAGLTRQPYYLNFGSLDAVLEALLRRELARFTASLEDADLALPISQGRLFAALLRFMSAEAELVDVVLCKAPAGPALLAFDAEVGRIYRRVVSVNGLAAGDAPFDRHFSAFVGHGLFGVVRTWAHDPEPAPLADMVAHLGRVLGPAFDAHFGALGA